MNTPISKPTLQNFLMSQGIDIVDVACDHIMPVSADYIANEFAQAFRRYLIVRDLGRYQPGKNQCAKFALHALELFSECYLVTKEAPDNTSGGFGMFDFTRRDGTGHAINIFVDRKPDGSLLACYFEPQTQSIITPTRKVNTPCKAEFR